MAVGQTAYNATLDRLYSYVDYSLVHAGETTSAVFSLARITELLERLGNPQNSFQSIHVAGTKGKGSVCALIYQVLLSAGYRTGMYTSPHLIRFNERFQQNGMMISDEDVVETGNIVMDAIDPHNPASSFDIMTAMAFLYFKKKGIEIAVIETGLGGRLDSTNVLTPIISVITPISLDHTAFLGNTIAEIAGEKAGIIKRGVPVITMQKSGEALTVLKRVAEDREAALMDVAQHYILRGSSNNAHSQRMMITRKEDQIENDADSDDSEKAIDLQLGMVGEHQITNAGIAFATLEKLAEMGFDIPIEAIHNGFSQVFWPCRFELINENPRIVLDGAHNLDSITSLIDTVRKVYPGERIILVFGVSEDKPYQAMLEKISSLTEKIILTRSEHPRSLSPQKMAALFKTDHPEVMIAEKLEMAVEMVESCDAKEIIVVTGSLFIAGGFRSIWMKKHPSLAYFKEDKGLE